MRVNNIGTREIGLLAVSALGIILALYSGNFIGDQNYAPVIIILGLFIIIMLFFGVGKKIYILIPIFWGVTGSITLLPLPFTVRQLFIILASAIFICGIIFKEKELKATFEPLDLWIWINIVWLAIAFFRNPVGFAAIGGGARVGGKPYVDVILGLMAYFILSRSVISAKFANKLPYWMYASIVAVSAAGAVATFLPEVGMKLGLFYDGFNPMTGDLGLDSEVTSGETRLIFLQTLGTALILLIVSKVNPFNLLRVENLSKLLLYISGLLMILLSGFRNAIMDVFMYTAASVIIRERFVGVIKVVIFLAIFVSLIFTLSYSPIKLPFTFQRAFSFMPGQWDAEAVSDAQGSSEWRYEMWQMVLTSDKYIRNKMLGDGFGFLRSDYEIMVDAMAGVGSGFQGGAQQEAFMINGDFHSGPVSTIRFVGYVGLAFFLPLLFILAKRGVQLINQSIGTPFQFCTLYIGIPIIICPFAFIFIFGDYRSDLVGVLFNAGMLKMLSSSLYQYNSGRSIVQNAVEASAPKS